MSRAPSALTAIGGFSVAVAGLSVAITASIVLLMPDPPAVRVTVAEAAAALRGRPTGLERRAAPPPDGMPAPLLRYVLARELGRPASAVRVVWLDRLDRKVPTNVVFMTSRSRPDQPPSTLIMPREKLTAPPASVTLKRWRMDPRQAFASISANPLMSGLYLTLPQPAFAAALRGPDGRWITVAPPRRFFGGWRLKVLAALAATLALLAPLAWLFARRLTRPFRALAAAIEDGREPPRLDGPRELREAAGAIVQLRARLAADAEERMRMLTAVAHDLRTPLTSLKLRIESAPEPQRTRMAADADRMGAMIGDVLAFARVADAPRAVVAVRPLVAAILADLCGAVTLAPGGDVRVAVVPEAFRRTVENLVRNAIDHAGGGRVEVTAAAGEAVLTVVDRGPGIAPADRARLVRPFERGEASRSRDTGGIGLGLSIVQSFADLHGGTLTLGDAPDGGAAVALRLPAA